jgi:two-component system chemotaxis sensor kinase CheA
MSFGEDEEILQDFLVEAGEILEQLSEQLVDLEQSPDDRDLLNAIFRGFHTVKGGAGFLQLGALVDLCHLTENLFDLLRNGQLKVTSNLMDVALQSLDAVNEMFAEVQDRVPCTPADPGLISRIESCLAGDADNVAEEEVPPEHVTSQENGSIDSAGTEPAQPETTAEGDLTDSDFEAFLDAIQEPEEFVATDSSETPTNTPSSAAPNDTESTAKNSDEITEDEFEALLDQIHGKVGGAKEDSEPQSPPSAPPAPDDSFGGDIELFDESPDSSATNSNEITEDEFERLLDELHGGAAPGVASASTPVSEPSSPSAGSDDLIDDKEFDDLLDQLHGAGKGPTASSNTAASAPPIEDVSPALVEAPAVAAKQEAVAAQGVSSSASTPATPLGSGVKPEPKEGVTAAKAPARGGKEAVAAETTVRVDTQRLDDIMNMVGELVLVRNRLVRLGLKSGDEEMAKAVSNLDVVTADLQTSVMKTRMQPIKKVFGRFPRVVRDLARTLKKEISLELQGEDTDLDKNLVEALADPLVHLVRNSVDHGIEMPADREAAGKARVGKVILAAEQEGDHILLSITDDGAGMDPEKLKSRCVEKGLLEEDTAARLSDTEAFDLIFMPGFSTKEQISDVSGRGVGMDVVKTKITQLNGSIEIQSKIGEGSRIAIKVPLTLAIMPTLMVMLGNQTFALPLVSVNEIFHMDLTQTNVVDGQEVVTVRDKALPLFYLKRWLVTDATSAEKPLEAHVVIVSVGTQRVGFVVDQLIGQEEVVIKPLGKMLQGTPGMAGATITGDGRIALILDVPSMLKRYAG